MPHHSAYYTGLLLHCLFSLIATQNILHRIDEGVVSEKMKRKVGDIIFSILNATNGNQTLTHRLFVFYMWVGNFIGFAYVFRVVSLIFKSKKENE